MVKKTAQKKTASKSAPMASHYGPGRKIPASTVKPAPKPAPKKRARTVDPMHPAVRRRVVNPAFDLPKPRPSVARARARENEKIEVTSASIEHAVEVLMDYIDSHPLATPSVEQQVTVGFYSALAGSCAERASLIRSEMRAAAREAQKKADESEDEDLDDDESEDDTED